MRILRYLVVTSILGVSGCVTTVPEDALKLSDTSLQDRQMQSRFFETKNETDLLAACIAVLQDMGYSIDEIEKNAGVVTASKTVDATNNAQVATAMLLLLLGGGDVAIDSQQKVEVSFVTTPSKSKGEGYIARVSFQRIVINTDGVVSRAETLNNKELYTEFFDKLSKSVFLEAHQI